MKTQFSEITTRNRAIQHKNVNDEYVLIQIEDSEKTGDYTKFHTSFELWRKSQFEAPYNAHWFDFRKENPEYPFWSDSYPAISTSYLCIAHEDLQDLLTDRISVGLYAKKNWVNNCTKWFKDPDKYFFAEYITLNPFGVLSALKTLEGQIHMLPIRVAMDGRHYNVHIAKEIADRIGVRDCEIHQADKGKVLNFTYVPTVDEAITVCSKLNGSSTITPLDVMKTLHPYLMEATSNGYRWLSLSEGTLQGICNMNISPVDLPSDDMLWLTRPDDYELYQYNTLYKTLRDVKGNYIPIPTRVVFNKKMYDEGKLLQYAEKYALTKPEHGEESISFYIMPTAQSIEEAKKSSVNVAKYLRYLFHVTYPDTWDCYKSANS